MDNNLYRDYYKIPTPEGYFYLYREYLNRGWNNTTGNINIEYNNFIELFTGIVVTPGNKVLDLNNNKDKIIFETIKKELLNFKELELNKNTISYNYLHFHNSYKSNNYSFANRPNYTNKLPYFNTNFIIEPAQHNFVLREKFKEPEYDYYKLSSIEFADDIKKLINNYGSYENSYNAILKVLENKSIDCQNKDEYIKKQLNKNIKETEEAEEYIKKLIY